MASGKDVFQSNVHASTITDQKWLPKNVQIRSQKVASLEKEMKKELERLKDVLAETDFAAEEHLTRLVSSISPPQSVEYHRAQRNKIFRTALEVPRPDPLIMHHEQLSANVNTCTFTELKGDSLPLVLHQFFKEREQQLVTKKYKCLLRWARFCVSTDVMERVRQEFEDFIHRINDEHADCRERLSRLSAATTIIMQRAELAEDIEGFEKVSKEENLDETKNPLQYVEPEDLRIYNQALIWNQHSSRIFDRFYRSLQWMSTTHRCQIVHASSRPNEDEDHDLAPALLVTNDTNEIAPVHRRRFSVWDSRLQISDVSNKNDLEPKGEAKSTSMVLPLQHTIELTKSNDQNKSVNSASDHDQISSPDAGKMKAASNSCPMFVSSFEDLRDYLEKLKEIYNISVITERLESQEGGMELLLNVTRKFNVIFQQQSSDSLFPAYDFDPSQSFLDDNDLQSIVLAGSKSTLAQSDEDSLKQKRDWLSGVSENSVRLQHSNWLPHVQFHGSADLDQENMLYRLSTVAIDDTLKIEAAFTHSTDPKYTEFRLKEVRIDGGIHGLTDEKGEPMFRRIYGDADGPSSSSGRKRNRREESQKELRVDEHHTLLRSHVQAYASMRYMRTRDMMRDVRNSLNYFRSVERTLTIDQMGFACRKLHKKKREEKTRKIGGEDIFTGAGTSESTSLPKVTPPKMTELITNRDDFMKFEGIENRDDFYSEAPDRPGQGGHLRLRVCDCKGLYIMYDVALADMDEIERQLLQVGTHYIENAALHWARENEGQVRSHSRPMRSRQNELPSAYLQRTVNNVSLDLAMDAQNVIDRCTVLQQLWEWEAKFQESKRCLVGLFFEIYEHVFDADEQYRLATVIGSIIRRRPRFDLSQPYFDSSYESELRCLQVEADVVALLLQGHIDHQRRISDRLFYKAGTPIHVPSFDVLEDPTYYRPSINNFKKETHTADIKEQLYSKEELFGFPDRIVPNQPIMLHLGHSNKHVYLFEFHPSLARISRFPDVVAETLATLRSQYPNTSVLDSIEMHRQLLVNCMNEFSTLCSTRALCGNFVPSIIKDISNENLADDPRIVSSIAATLCVNQDDTPIELHHRSIAVWTQTIEIVTLRHRLLATLEECSLLSAVYLSQADMMLGDGDNSDHLYIVPKGLDQLKEECEHILNEENDEDSGDEEVGIDGEPSVANSEMFMLSINELMSVFGTLSFATLDALQDNFQIGSGSSRRIRLALKLQELQRSILIIAIGYNEVSLNPVQLIGTSKNELWVVPPNSNQHVQTDTSFLKPNFISLRKHKLKVRRKIMTQWLRDVGEKERENIGDIFDFTDEFAQYMLQDMSRFALRIQISRVSNAISDMVQKWRLLDSPIVISESEKKKNGTNVSQSNANAVGDGTGSDSIPHSPSAVSDLGNVDSSLPVINSLNFSRNSAVSTEQKWHECKPTLREQRLLHACNNEVANLWYVPNFEDILTIGIGLSLSEQEKSLELVLRILWNLHALYAFFYSQVRFSLGTSDTVLSTHGSDTLAVEIRRMESELVRLEDPSDPELVARYLNHKREVLYMHCELMLRYSLRETLLSKNSMEAFRITTADLDAGNNVLTNFGSADVFPNFISVPTVARDNHIIMESLFQRSNHLTRTGGAPVFLWKPCSNVKLLDLWMLQLPESDRNSANGEILGCNLLLDDVLCDRSIYIQDDPIRSLVVLDAFVTLGFQLEQMKRAWATEFLGLSRLDSQQHWTYFSSTWDRTIVKPSLSRLRDEISFGRIKISRDNFTEHGSRTENDKIEENTPEAELRLLQLWALYEHLELHLLYRVKDTTTELINDVLAERTAADVIKCESKTLLWHNIKARMTGVRSNVARTSDEVHHEISPAIQFSANIKSSINDLPKDSNTNNNSLRNLLGDNMAPLPMFFLRLGEYLQQDLLTEEQMKKGYFHERDVRHCIALLVHETSCWFDKRIQEAEHSLVALNNHLHHLLYMRECEVVHLANGCRKELLQMRQQFKAHVADACYGVMIELQETRSRLKETEEKLSHVRRDVRAEIKAEYRELIETLCNSLVQLKNQYAEFQCSLRTDMYDRLQQVRDKSIRKIINASSFRDDATKEFACHSVVTSEERIGELNACAQDLWNLIYKMRTMSTLRLSGLRTHYEKKVYALKCENTFAKKALWEAQLEIEQRACFNKQEITQLRKSLANQEEKVECTIVELNSEIDRRRILQEWKKSKERKMADDDFQKLGDRRESEISRLNDLLEHQKEDLRELKATIERDRRQSEIAEARNVRAQKKLQKELQEARDIKVLAFAEIDTLRRELECLTNKGSPFSGTERLPRNRFVHSTILEKSGVSSEISESVRPYTAPSVRANLDSDARSSKLLEQQPSHIDAFKQWLERSLDGQQVSSIKVSPSVGSSRQEWKYNTATLIERPNTSNSGIISPTVSMPPISQNRTNVVRFESKK